jgi:hypothetical protein
MILFVVQKRSSEAYVMTLWMIEQNRRGLECQKSGDYRRTLPSQKKNGTNWTETQ